ncbi:Hint domain-containing protein [Planktotalea sp.]|uniref:Hint domain-containing protein n=1 Tax=Planktotalea sp. TaxID=2029877 RepID=UPI003D6BEDEE
MSNLGNSLVLRKTVDPVVCKDLDAGGMLPHQAAYCPCFTPGTLVKTDYGECAVEDITVGMRVLTRDNGYQPVVWTGQRSLTKETLAQFSDLHPVQIAQGALGNNLPERDMKVSPQHRMLLNNAQIRQWFEADEVLIAAHLLTCFEGVERETVEDVTYIHFMCAQHEIVLADGAWTESYQPSDMRLGAIDERHRTELLSIFPELAEGAKSVFPAARATISQSTFVETVFPSE